MRESSRERRTRRQEADRARWQQERDDDAKDLDVPEPDDEPVTWERMQ